MEFRRMANLAVSRLCSVKSLRLDHGSLRLYLRVGLRRGTWARLGAVQKALYRCGLWVAKTRGTISSTKLSVSILSIISKLMTTIKTRIYAMGVARARALWSNYISAGVFDWAPEAKAQFSRVEYVMYLGIMELNG
jgi:hypothetical protein